MCVGYDGLLTYSKLFSVFLMEIYHFEIQL